MIITKLLRNLKCLFHGVILLEVEERGSQNTMGSFWFFILFLEGTESFGVNFLCPMRVLVLRRRLITERSFVTDT
jgi:hypothetical protein